MTGYIYDQNKLMEYERWIVEKRHGISRKTARHYARMMLRSEAEGLSTMDDVYNKYWGWGYSVRADMQSAIRLRKELEFEEEGKE